MVVKFSDVHGSQGRNNNTRTRYNVLHSFYFGNIFHISFFKDKFNPDASVSQIRVAKSRFSNNLLPDIIGSRLHIL